MMKTLTVPDLVAQLRSLNRAELEMLLEFVQEAIANLPDEDDERPLKPEFAEQIRRYERGETTLISVDEVVKALRLDA